MPDVAIILASIGLAISAGSTAYGIYSKENPPSAPSQAGDDPIRIREAQINEQNSLITTLTDKVHQDEEAAAVAKKQEILLLTVGGGVVLFLLLRKK